MSVISTPVKNSVSVRLHNGTKSGNVVTVGVNLGKISVSGWDAQKAMNIVDSMKPCLSKNVYQVLRTEVTQLDNDE